MAQALGNFGCTMLLNTNKKGLLKSLEDGYYLTVLGAYGAYNSMGQYYDEKSGLAFLEPTAQLMRQASKGVLRGEYTHPECLPGMTDADYIARLRKIDAKLVSHHVRNVYPEYGHKDEKGRPIVLVLGEIGPTGPYGNTLRSQMENRHENVYFSVRSLTVDDHMRGIKYTRDLITWDYVNEGGIFVANKFNSPALESFSMQELSSAAVTPITLYQAKRIDQRARMKGIGVESHGADYDELARRLGYHEQAAKTPIYTGW